MNICKNCGHEVDEDEEGEIMHAEYATIVFNKVKKRLKLKCSCGCTNPEVKNNGRI